MTINFEIPHELEQLIQTDGADPNREAKEAYLVELYRRDRITRDDLGEGLGLGLHAMEQLLKKHGIEDDLSGPGPPPKSGPLASLTEAMDEAWDAGRLTPEAIQEAIGRFRRAHPYGR
jgi:predicted HTH domain antitoxin